MLEDDVASDLATKVTRFVCGFAFFALAGFLFFGAKFGSTSMTHLMLAAGATGFVGGVFAVRYGDALWIKVRDIFP